MRQNIKKTPFAAWSDRVLARAAIVGAGLAWFIALWGLSLPALTAGLALGGLLLLCVDRFAVQTVQKREKQMRARLGGELALEALLTQEPRRASFRAALWLMRKAPLEMLRTTDTGVICQLEGKRALVLALALPQSVPVDAARLADARRHALRCGVEACVLCLTSPPTREAEQYAESGEPRLRLVKREELLPLAGACSPATDEQLRGMGRRKRYGARRWLRHILDRRRAKRYFLYGAGLAAMYFVTGLSYYPIPAVLCLLMSLLCVLCRPKWKESFL